MSLVLLKLSDSLGQRFNLALHPRDRPVQSIRVPLQNGAGGAFVVGGWVGIGDGLRVVLSGLEALEGACLASEGLCK